MLSSEFSWMGKSNFWFVKNKNSILTSFEKDNRNTLNFLDKNDEDVFILSYKD